jgi:ATP-binding cassette, subfamily B, bacterial MsbA
MRNPFWQSAKILLGFKRPLLIALVGALVSAGCFGAGIGMLVPTIQLLLNKDEPGHELDPAIKRLEDPNAPPEYHKAADWLRQNHPEYDSRPPLTQLVDRKLGAEKNPQIVRDVGKAIEAHLPTDPLGSFAVVMGFIAVLTLIGSVGRYIHELLVVTVVFRAGQVWRTRVFERLILAPMDLSVKQGYADNVSRLISDTTQMTNGYQAILGKTVAELLKGAAALTVALLINPWLTMLALTTAPLIAVLLRKFAKRVRRASNLAMKQRGRMLAMLNESLGSLAVVKSHNAEGFERRRFHRVNRDMVRQQMRARQAKALASPVVESLALLAVMGVATAAAVLIYRHGYQPTEFMVVLVALGAAGASVRPLSTLNNDLAEAGAAATRVLGVLDLPIEPLHIDTRTEQPTLRRHEREVWFDRVSYSYPGAASPALKSVSLRVPHGQTVAIVGGNGAGKTTLLSTLPRLLRPSDGRVLIDGVDIAPVDLRSLRSQIAVVSQQSTLFEGTIAQNIAYGRRHESMDRITAAARAAFADEFVRALPLGYETMLGESGSGLSGGQKQRLCIARAILRDPTILILDEATSQIDADSEAKITQALAELRLGRTTFIIAHRLSTVVDSDLIVVMGDGGIIDQGTHDELLSRCETYISLTRNQLRTPMA